MFVYIDDRQQLNKICDQLLNLEISKEDLLKMNECEIDSTTNEKISKKPKLDQGSKKSKNVAKAEASRIRAEEIFKTKSDIECDVLKEQLYKQQQLIEKLQKHLQEKSK